MGNEPARLVLYSSLASFHTLFTGWCEVASRYPTCRYAVGAMRSRLLGRDAVNVYLRTTLSAVSD